MLSFQTSQIYNYTFFVCQNCLQNLKSNTQGKNREIQELANS